MTPRIRLTGVMTCPPEQAGPVRDALPEHIRLTRAEPGCLSFDVVETAPGVFSVAELFENRAAFDAHQLRTRSSGWFRTTHAYPRDYAITEDPD